MAQWFGGRYLHGKHHKMNQNKRYEIKRVIFFHLHAKINVLSFCVVGTFRMQ